MKILGIPIPLSVYTSGTEYIVVGQRPAYIYADGKPTNELEGVKLELYDDSQHDRFVVKIPVNKLPFTDEQVASQTIRVSLTNPMVKIYNQEQHDGTLKLSVSIKADGIKELKKA